MPDKKDMRGETDRNRVANDEKWEVDYLIEQTGATPEEIADAIKTVGNNREKVEEYLWNKRVL